MRFVVSGPKRPVLGQQKNMRFSRTGYLCEEPLIRTTSVGIVPRPRAPARALWLAAQSAQFLLGH